jgi:hypothetical protein
MKFFNLFVLCDGCRKKTTITYKAKDKTKIAKCSFCLKITEHKLPQKNVVSNRI